MKNKDLKMLEEAYLNGVISEKEYNDKITAIEKEASDKRKEIKEKDILGTKKYLIGY